MTTSMQQGRQSRPFRQLPTPPTAPHRRSSSETGQQPVATILATSSDSSMSHTSTASTFNSAVLCSDSTQPTSDEEMICLRRSSGRRQSDPPRRIVPFTQSDKLSASTILPHPSHFDFQMSGPYDVARIIKPLQAPVPHNDVTREKKSLQTSLSSNKPMRVEEKQSPNVSARTSSNAKVTSDKKPRTIGSTKLQTNAQESRETPVAQQRLPPVQIVSMKKIAEKQRSLKLSSSNRSETLPVAFDASPAVAEPISSGALKDEIKSSPQVSRMPITVPYYNAVSSRKNHQRNSHNRAQSETVPPALLPNSSKMTMAKEAPRMTSRSQSADSAIRTPNKYGKLIGSPHAPTMDVVVTADGSEFVMVTPPMSPSGIVRPSSYWESPEQTQGLRDDEYALAFFDDRAFNDGIRDRKDSAFTFEDGGPPGWDRLDPIERACLSAMQHRRDIADSCGKSRPSAMSRVSSVLLRRPSLSPKKDSSSPPRRKLKRRTRSITRPTPLSIDIESRHILPNENNMTYPQNQIPLSPQQNHTTSQQTCNHKIQNATISNPFSLPLDAAQAQQSISHPQTINLGVNTDWLAENEILLSRPFDGTPIVRPVYSERQITAKSAAGSIHLFSQPSSIHERSEDHHSEKANDEQDRNRTLSLLMQIDDDMKFLKAVKNWHSESGTSLSNLAEQEEASHSEATRSAFLIRELISTEKSYSKHLQRLLSWSNSNSALPFPLFMPQEESSDLPYLSGSSLHRPMSMPTIDRDAVHECAEYKAKLSDNLPLLLLVSNLLEHRWSENASVDGIAAAFIELHAQFKSAFTQYIKSLPSILDGIRADNQSRVVLTPKSTLVRPQSMLDSPEPARKLVRRPVIPVPATPPSHSLFTSSQGSTAFERHAESAPSSPVMPSSPVGPADVSRRRSWVLTMSSRSKARPRAGNREHRRSAATLDCADVVIMPLQRVTRYRLFLVELLKTTLDPTSCAQIDKALTCVLDTTALCDKIENTLGSMPSSY